MVVVTVVTQVFPFPCMFMRLCCLASPRRRNAWTYKNELVLNLFPQNIDECSSQPCLNDGICVSRSGSYECRCLLGYLGDHCEIEQSKQRQCNPKACPQFAECVDVGNTVTCVCKPEYPGDYPNCNVETSCGNTPCLNGGICNPIKGTCSCPDGFTGKSFGVFVRMKGNVISVFF